MVAAFRYNLLFDFTEINLDCGVMIKLFSVVDNAGVVFSDNSVE